MISFDYDLNGGHSSQIQQKPGIDILKSSSNFYHLIASMGEVFPDTLGILLEYWTWKYIKVSWGSGDAYPTLLCSLGMKGCPPQVFRALIAEVPCQTLQLYNTNYYIRVK